MFGPLETWVAVAFTLNPSYIDTRPHWPHLRWLLALVLRSAPNPFHRFRHRRRPLELSKSRRVFVSGAALSFGLKELREIEAAGALRSVGATRARCGYGPARRCRSRRRRSQADVRGVRTCDYRECQCMRSTGSYVERFGKSRWAHSTPSRPPHQRCIAPLKMPPSIAPTIPENRHNIY